MGSVHQTDEVDAVSYDNGAWIQIVADDGTKGYINAYYADYLTCYPVAETLEEEQDRLRNQADTSETGEGSGQGAIYGVEKAAEYTEPVSYDSESSSDTGSVVDGSGNDGYTESSDSYDSGYSEENTDTSTSDGSQDYSTDTSGDESWDNSSDASDDTTWSDTSDSGSADSTGSGDSYTESDNSTAETDGSYSEPDNSYIEPEAPETDASYSEPETSAPETDAPYTEPETSAPETDAPYTEPETSAPETEAPATEDTSSSSDLGQQIASYAVQFVGNPYVYGGTSLTNGADCSGFVQSVFANFGIGLSRTAASQASGGTSVSLDSLQAGDLLFYSSSGSGDHVALYIGGGQIVHAANSASGIIISNAYYSTPVAARRYW